MTDANVPVFRALTLGEIFDQAIRLYRRNFLTFVGIIAIMQIPLSLAALVIALVTMRDPLMLASVGDFSNMSDILTPQYFLGMGSGLILAVLNFFLVQGVATAAFVRAVADSRLGRPVSIIQAYRSIASSWQRLLLALFLFGFVVIAAFIWTMIPCVGWLSGLGILVFAVTVIGPLIPPVVMLERHSASTSVRRAWELARRRFWWMLGFAFILYLFNLLIASGPALILNYVMQYLLLSADNLATTYTISQTIQSLVTLFMSLLYLPLQLTAFTLVYFDLRVRSEGFDLQVMAHGDLAGDLFAGTEGQDPIRPEPGIASRESSSDIQQADIRDLTANVPQPSGPLVTSTEVGYFAVMTIGLGVLYVAFTGILMTLMTAMFASLGSGY